MPNIVRVPITNIYMDGDYTGVITVGPEKKSMNVILDTGSSALALDGTKYQPDLAGGDQSTDLAQTDSYGDGSTWTGAVIRTTLTLGSNNSSVVLKGGNAAIAYQASSNMFGSTDGILGLAYAPLDDAFQMPQDTWKDQYTSTEVRAGKPNDLVPYLTQLADAGVTSDKIAFYTHRSFVHVGNGGANDPLNQGWMVVGGGEESTDLYTGSFQLVKVLSDAWYCTNLKEVIVGSSSPIAARLQGPRGMPSNSIIDSGTNSLNLGPQMLKAILSKFPAAQKKLLAGAIDNGDLVSVADLKLDQWPTITFVLQGDAADVRLAVPPSNYWQVNTQQAGFAAAAITKGEAGLAILGLPLLNGYFTIFDGEADGGKGVVKFATAKV
jgi:Eukaryotic aspartyl protease